jgi:hypothetical protein
LLGLVILDGVHIKPPAKEGATSTEAVRVWRGTHGLLFTRKKNGRKGEYGLERKEIKNKK